jgi:hypothetical protein
MDCRKIALASHSFKLGARGREEELFTVEVIYVGYCRLVKSGKFCTF